MNGVNPVLPVLHKLVEWQQTNLLARFQARTSHFTGQTGLYDRNGEVLEYPSHIPLLSLPHVGK